MSSDDVRTVAVPLTQEQAMDLLYARALEAQYETEGGLLRAAIAGVLSASPEVLAAAMGGHVSRSGTGVTCIVLPPREVSRGDQ